VADHDGARLEYKNLRTVPTFALGAMALYVRVFITITEYSGIFGSCYFCVRLVYLTLKDFGRAAHV
jgi:hypothetical protein